MGDTRFRSSGSFYKTSSSSIRRLNKILLCWIWRNLRAKKRKKSPLTCFLIIILFNEFSQVATLSFKRKNYFFDIKLAKKRKKRCRFSFFFIVGFSRLTFVAYYFKIYFYNIYQSCEHCTLFIPSSDLLAF